MEFMYSWYPMVATIAGIIYGIAVYIVGKKGHVKTALAMVAFAIFMIIFKPVRIDGTKTQEFHNTNVKQRTVEYKGVQKEAEIVKIKKPTFQERLDAEAARAKKANQEIKDEIYK